jgi:predicted membrane-bound dolichyl-phosphate-mannose-protein mannosyltransferase
MLSVCSLVARLAWIGEPCRSPCRSPADHILVFDESYYVNAARVIAGVRPPAGAMYADAPLGDDPNAEHPQLAKLIMAGSIELFGDRPLAWRLGSVICGALAIVGLYALVRAAGGGQWLALGAAALMAFDNLVLVHGRIGTLDVYVLVAMIWAAVAYLRRHPVVAGALIGVGACCKLVAPYLLLVFVVFEALRWWRDRSGGRRRLAHLSVCAAAAAAVFFGLLALLGRIAPPYDPVTGKVIGGGPFAHFSYILSYAASVTSPTGAHGIASYPWEWLLDLKPITYLNINPAKPVPGLYNIHPASHFIGIISPPIMLLALPALAFALPATIRERNDVGAIALAWFIGTFLPFVLLSLFWRRTSYLFYMLIVMPGIYLAVAQLIAISRVSWKLVAVWAAAVLAAAVVLYPFTPWP